MGMVALLATPVAAKSPKKQRPTTVSTKSDTLPVQPVKLGDMPRGGATNLLRDVDGAIQFSYLETTGRDSVSWLEMRSTDEGTTWSAPQIIATTGNAHHGDFATISPLSGEMILFYKNTDGTPHYIRTANKRRDASYHRPIGNKQTVHFGYGSCLWVDMPSGGKRVITGSHADNQGVTYYVSDDDGLTFRASNTIKVPNLVPNIWITGAVEPALVELRDGRLWTLLRSSNDVLWESFSADKGLTWSEPTPTTIRTGPNSWVSARRLSTGDLAIFWNNAQYLPPVATDGAWNFTNRDVLHIALSSDDGKTWRGMREVWLDGLRNGGFINAGGDKGLNESKIVEMKDGKLLIATGQAPGHRSMVVVDPRWVDIKDRSDDFSNGLKNWSTNMIVRRPPHYTLQYHYNYERKEGARLVADPDDSTKKALKLIKDNDPTLYNGRQGAVWNFPAARAGELTLGVRFAKGFGGASIALTDVWSQPTNDLTSLQAPYLIFVPTTLEYGSFTFAPDKWYEMTVKWNENQATVYVDGVAVKTIEKAAEYLHGLSYLRLRNEAVWDDAAGFFVRNVKEKALN